MNRQPSGAEITYELIDASHAPALQELELSVFSTIDPHHLYHEPELIELAEIFPAGNFVALDEGIPIGMGLGVLVDFDFESPQHALIDVASNEHHGADKPWYYGTDISVYPEYRGRGVGRQLYELRKQAVRDLNKAGIVAGGVLPGYAKHLHDMTADDYIDKVRSGEFYDPTLTFQIENGFEAVCALADYIDDATVGNNSVLIVWHNPDYKSEA